MSFLQTKPYFLNSCEGTKLKMSDASVCVKATSEQTGGLFNLFEIECPGGFSTPMHIHYMEDVTVFVLQGELWVFWGEERRQATVGAYIFLPRGTPHGFLVEGGNAARILYATLPAGFDQFLSANSLGTYDPSANAARHKIEILGPLPE
jgi:quercetin dioxygenase-like cupin family protein